MANRIRGIKLEIDGDVTGLDKALKEVNGKLGTTQASLKDVERLLKLDPTNTELLAQKQQLLKDAVASTKEKLDQLKEAQKQAKQQLESGDLGQDKYDALQREIVETEEKLKSLESQAKQSSSTLGTTLQQAGEKINSAGEKMSQAGGTLTKTVTTPIIGIGTAIVKTTADFDAQMSKVQAISGASGDEFDALREKAREMGEKTKFSATEAGEGFEYMAMAGWKTDQMLEGIEPVMQLAAAAGTDLGTTSDIVTDALTAFGLSAEDTGHFADILAAASTNANTNVEMMGETFKYVAPVAGAVGYSAEDMAVAIGLAANSGIKASQAGTSLRRIIQNLVKPTKESQAAMDRLGISIDDGNGHMYSFRDMMDQLRGSFGQLKMPVSEFNEKVADLDDKLASGELTEKAYNKEMEELMTLAYGAEGATMAQTAAMLAGTNGMSALLAIVNASDEDYQKLTESIDTCSDEMDGYNGVTEKMAAVMQDNLNGQVTILMSQLQELAISLGDILMPIVREAVGAIQKIVDKLNGLSESQKEQIVQIAGIVAAVGPALLIVGKVVGVAGTLITGLGKLSTAIGAAKTAMGAATAAGGALGSIGLFPIIAIAAAVIATGVALYQNWDKIKEAAGQLKEKLEEKWGELKEKTAEAWENIKTKTAETWESVKTKTAETWEKMKNSAKETWDKISEKVSSGAESARSKAVEKWENLKEKTGAAWEAIRTKTENAWKMVSEKVSSAAENARSKAAEKWDSLKEKTGTAWETIKTKTTETWENLRDKISQAMDNAKREAGEKLASIKDAFERSGIQGVAQTIWGDIKRAFTDGFDAIDRSTGGRLSDIKGKFDSGIREVWNKVDYWVGQIKGLFNFEWSFPKIKMPHFSWEWKGVGNPPIVYYPEFSIDWYKKAMDRAMVLKGATIFGQGADGTMLGGGEAGNEVVAGESHLLDMIQRATANAVAAAGMTQATNVTYGDINMTVYGAEGQDVRELARIVEERISDRVGQQEAVWA